ncbi:MAG TPA: enoyl-CoA hydratase/isomerase family protein [Planctomycetota bacterium]|nr:enoyl-CoA hydratase/isomerase family protein [Planctomycetota bacterium]
MTVHREQRGSVCLLRMEHGKANALDIELFEELGRALDSVSSPVVLTGTGSIFSAGVDLFRVLQGGRPYGERFLPLLSDVARKLFTFPRPVIAALNGHAIAGGCVLALACDRRLMSGGKIGVPELLVGVPFPAMPLELLRAALTPRVFRDVVLSGRTVPPDEAVALGLVDEVVPADSLVDRACEAAARLAEIPAQSFALTKEQIAAPVLERERASRELDRRVLDTWCSDVCRAAIQAYVDKTIKRK